jgi:hypothetical protein
MPYYVWAGVMFAWVSQYSVFDNFSAKVTIACFAVLFFGCVIFRNGTSKRLWMLENRVIAACRQSAGN